MFNCATHIRYNRVLRVCGGKEPKAGRKQSCPNKHKLSALKTAVAGGPLTAALPLKPFPGLGGAPAFSASTSYSSNWKEKGEDRGPSGQAPFRPPERQSSAQGEICCLRFGRGGGQRSRPPGRGAELARSGAGMASKPGP